MEQVAGETNSYEFVFFHHPTWFANGNVLGQVSADFQQVIGVTKPWKYTTTAPELLSEPMCVSRRPSLLRIQI